MQNKIITFSVIASLVFFSTITCQNAPVAENLQLQDITDVDKVPPTVEALNFSEGMYLSKDMIISGTANDNTQIVKIEVQIDENGWQEITTAALWYHTLSVTGLTEGAHTFSVRVTDAAGLQTSQTYSFIYQPVLYVSIATGNDLNSGLLASPLKTIGKAIEISGVKGIPEIKVAEGIYSGVITISHNVNLGGSYNSDFSIQSKTSYLSTINNPLTYLPTVNISGASVTSAVVENFRIEGCNCEETIVKAIYISGYAKPILKNNIIFGGINKQTAGFIYAIWVQNYASPTISQNVIDGGFSHSREYGISISFNASAYVNNNLILLSPNKGGGYGIAVQAESHVVAVHNAIRISGGTIPGIGIYLENTSNSQTIIANNIIEIIPDGYAVKNNNNVTPAVYSNNITITGNPYCLGMTPDSNCVGGEVIDPATAGGITALQTAGSNTVEGNITLDGIAPNDIYSILTNVPKGTFHTSDRGADGNAIYNGTDLILETIYCLSIPFVDNEYIEYDNNDIPLQISAGGVDCTTSTSFITFTPALPAASVHNKTITLWGTNNTNLVEDYRLKPGSIAIDAGRDISAYYPVNGIEIVDLDDNTLGYDDAASVDFDGSKNDIGPYEWYP